MGIQCDERYLAAGGLDDVVSLVDLETGHVTSVAHGGGTRALAFHPSGKILASGGGDEVFIWTVPDGKKCQRVRTGGSVNILRFNDTGDYLLAAQPVGSVAYLHLWLVSRLWKWWRLRPVPRFSISSTIRALAFSTFSPADFAVATEGGGVHFCWAGHRGNEPCRIDEEYRNLHDHSVTALAFRPYDKALSQLPGLVTGSKDGTAREWLTTDEIARVVHTSAVEAIAYSSDGRQIITATDEGGVYVWESQWLDVHEARRQARRDAIAHDETGLWAVEQSQLEGDALIDEICRRLPRTFTIDEWRRIFGDEPYRVTCPGLPLT